MPLYPTHFRLGSGAGRSLVGPLPTASSKALIAMASLVLSHPLLVAAACGEEPNRMYNYQDYDDAAELSQTFDDEVDIRRLPDVDIRPQPKDNYIYSKRVVHGNVHLPGSVHGDVHLPTPRPQRNGLMKNALNRIFKTTMMLTGLFAAMVLINMHHGLTAGPTWDPAGTTSFEEWAREVAAWLNVTSSRLNPSQQAAALQLGLRGVARQFALTFPPAVIQHGAAIV